MILFCNYTYSKKKTILYASSTAPRVETRAVGITRQVALTFNLLVVPPLETHLILVFPVTLPPLLERDTSPPSKKTKLKVLYVKGKTAVDFCLGH
jgi:hypothetical protein